MNTLSFSVSAGSQEFRRPGYTIEVGLGENPLPLAQFAPIYADNIGILVTAAMGCPQNNFQKPIDMEDNIS